ncbi:MAG: hypothetical protein WAV46_04880 [Candidatus Moraniibacteriota bacterium]
MNAHPFENGSVPTQEQVIEQNESVAERSPETLSETLSQIQKIESMEEASPDGDFGMAKMGERVNADQSEIEAAEGVIHFQERAQDFGEKRQEIRQVFEAKVRKALLPVAAALTMNWGAALAQEAPEEQFVATPEILTVVAKTETRELKVEDVFDRHSPLAQSSEMQKKLERPMTAEELATVEALHEKAWQGKNEVMSFSGRDKDGKYVIQTKESGPIGGRLEFEADEFLTDKVSSHTHPVEAASATLGISALAIREGKSKAIIMPPSTVDIGQCMNDASRNILQRVVDPRGVWEYECDANHPFTRSRNKAGKDLAKAIEAIQMRYAVDTADFEQAFSSVQDVHPAFMMARTFSALESKYPGIEKSGQDIFGELFKSDNALGLSFLEYDQEGSGLSLDSSEASDEENAKKIAAFIKNAEKRGIFLSYIPFREPLFKTETAKTVSVLGSTAETKGEKEEREAEEE